MTQEINVHASTHSFDTHSIWRPGDDFTVAGASALRVFIDIDDDGLLELVCNLGAVPDFVAYKQDGSVVWRQTITTADPGKAAYYPKLTPDRTALLYGHRANNTVYCVDIDDGAVRWSHACASGLVSMDVADVGLVVGSNGGSGQVNILDYTTGSSIGGGWPITYDQHEQLICCGDLDGDGEDEIVLNNNAGGISVRKRDASELFAISSGHTHVDQQFICDINGDSDNELVTIIDDDTSEGGNEGDEIAIYNASGTQLASASVGAQAAIAIGKFRPDLTGLQVAYGIEETATVGLLASDLTSLWTKSQPLGWIPDNAVSTGSQIIVGDFDGDGYLEVANSTGEFGATARANGFIVRDRLGEIVTPLWAHGWDFDPSPLYSNGHIRANRAQDIDADGREELWASPLGTGATTGAERFTVLRIANGTSLNTKLREHWPLGRILTGTTDRWAGTVAHDQMQDVVGTMAAVAGLGGRNAARFVLASGHYLRRSPAIGQNLGDLDPGNGDFTVAGLVRFNSLGAGTNPGIIAKETSGSSRQWRIDYIQSAGAFRAFLFASDGTVAATVSSVKAIDLNVWYAVFAWYDSTNSTIWLQINDDEPVSAAATGTPATGTAIFYMGTFGGGGKLDGDMQSWRFWHRQLSLADREEVYNVGNWRFGELDMPQLSVVVGEEAALWWANQRPESRVMTYEIDGDAATDGNTVNGWTLLEGPSSVVAGGLERITLIPHVIGYHSIVIDDGLDATVFNATVSGSIPIGDYAVKVHNGTGSTQNITLSYSYGLTGPSSVEVAAGTSEDITVTAKPFARNRSLARPMNRPETITLGGDASGTINVTVNNPRNR